MVAISANRQSSFPNGQSDLRFHLFVIGEPAWRLCKLPTVQQTAVIPVSRGMEVAVGTLTL
jgi:hypothetical protein